MNFKRIVLKFPVFPKIRIILIPWYKDVIEGLETDTFA